MRNEKWAGDFKLRPTNYGDIKFRSKLEAKWAALFDSMGIEYEYEPYTIKNRKLAYLPDFILHNVSFLPQTFEQKIRPVFFEVKHRQYQPTEHDGAKWLLALNKTPALLVAYGIGYTEGSGAYTKDDYFLSTYDNNIESHGPLAFFKNGKGIYVEFLFRGNRHDFLAFDTAYEIANRAAF